MGSGSTAPSGTPASFPWRRGLFTLASLAVTVGVFSYLLRHVSVAQVLDLIRNAHSGAVLLFVLLSLFQSLLRTWRYRMLLRFSGTCPGTMGLFLVVLVRNFTSDLLPARLGTLAYIFVVNARLGVPLVQATSSYTLVFLMDILAIVPLIMAALILTIGAGMLPIWPLLGAAAALAALTIALTLLLPPLARRLAHLLRRAAPPGAKPWRASLAGRMEQVADEMTRARQAGLYGPLLTLSVLVRLAKYGALYVFLYALLQPLGYTWSDLNPLTVFLGLCAAELAASLPVSGIGAFGAYEGAWAAAFELLGFPGHLSKLTAISHHLFTQVYGYGLGALAFLLLLLPVFRPAAIVPTGAGEREALGRFASRILAALAIVILSVWMVLRWF
jgi:uncharacterized membrane protein YbhN (UPF0104 family)